MIPRQLPSSVLKLLLLPIMALAISNCAGNELLRPDEYEPRNDVDIAISTVDGLRIVFSKGDYETLRRNDSLVIRGEGIITSEGKNSLNKPFHGELQQSSIEHIQVLDYRLHKIFTRNIWWILGIILLII